MGVKYLALGQCFIIVVLTLGVCSLGHEVSHSDKWVLYYLRDLTNLDLWVYHVVAIYYMHNNYEYTLVTYMTW